MTMPSAQPGSASVSVGISPSLFDRLSAPATVDRSGPAARTESSSQYDSKAVIRRDLERLLNTRWRSVGPSPELKELETSLVNYGLPDCTGAGIGVGSGREDLRRTIERTIQKFEPRFRAVRVSLIGNSDRMDRTLRFRIDAVLQGTAEQVAFDSAVEMSTASVTVRRSAR
jgi:type VI secretion system protein ImpF